MVNVYVNVDKDNNATADAKTTKQDKPDGGSAPADKPPPAK
jgi:hypothetical protein